MPDVYISFATLFSIRAGAVAWGFSIAGSLAAVMAISAAMQLLHLPYLAWLPAIPGISAGLAARVGQQVASDGLPWTPLLVLGGVPLKLYAAAAFAGGTSLAAVLAWTVFARVARILPTFAVAAALRGTLGRRIDARPRAWIATHLTFWVLFYVFYFVTMSQR